MVNPEGMGVVDTDDVGIVEERLRILNKMQRTTQVIRVDKSSGRDNLRY